MDDILFKDDYHIPRVCKKCGGIMIFKGVGEYSCEECGAVAYDDYGKVRRYIEENRGATAAQIEADIGVSQKTIRQMLREGRLEVTADSRAFLHCEVCGRPIRSGAYCPECETKVHRMLESQQREQKKKNIQGFGQLETGDEGKRRFTRS